MDFGFTYSDIITTIADWIIANCDNTTKDKYTAIGSEFINYYEYHVYTSDEWTSWYGYYTGKEPYSDINWDWPNHRSDYSKDIVRNKSVYQKSWIKTKYFATPTAETKIVSETAIIPATFNGSYIQSGTIQQQLKNWLKTINFDIDYGVSVNGLLTISELIIYYITQTITYRVSYLTDKYHLEFHQQNLDSLPSNIYFNKDIHDDLVRLYQTIWQDNSKLGLLEYIYSCIEKTSIKFIPISNVQYTISFGTRTDPPDPPIEPYPLDSIEVECKQISAVVTQKYNPETGTYYNVYTEAMPVTGVLDFEQAPGETDSIIVSYKYLDSSNYTFRIWKYDDTYDESISDIVSPGYIEGDAETTNPTTVKFTRNGTADISCILVAK